MPLRPLALVSLLALGDYMLWNWSLADNHDVAALVSGLTLPPLALACLWLLALTLGRGLGQARRRARERERERKRGTTGARHARRGAAVSADGERMGTPGSGRRAPTGDPAMDQAPVAAASPTRSSGKLAA